MVILVLVTLISGQAQTGDVAAITELETTWNDAHLRGDVAPLQQLFADDLVVIVPGMRPLSKGDSLAVFASGRMTFHRYASSDLAVRVYTDTAVVTGRLQRTRGMADGTKADDNWRFTKVYVRRTGRWQVVSFHASNTAP